MTPEAEAARILVVGADPALYDLLGEWLAEQGCRMVEQDPDLIVVDVHLPRQGGIEALKPHLDWPSAQTVGTHVDVSHCAPTPPGLEVRVRVKLMRVEGRRLVFEVEAHDGVELVSSGTHERSLIDGARFAEKLKRKRR